jgi:hypothetical protein
MCFSHVDSFSRRSHKRLTVVFRGSVLGTRDWDVNLKFAHTSFDAPSELKERIKDDIKLHSGFSGKLAVKALLTLTI